MKTSNSLEASNIVKQHYNMITMIMMITANMYCRNPVPVFGDQSRDAGLAMKHSGR